MGGKRKIPDFSQPIFVILARFMKNWCWLNKLNWIYRDFIVVRQKNIGKII